MTGKIYVTHCHWCGSITELPEDLVYKLRNELAIKFICKNCGVENDIKVTLKPNGKDYTAEEIHLGRGTTGE